MKKKLAILLVGTMIASSILAGCGSKKSEPTKKETSGELKGDITFWHSFTQGPRMEVIQQTADQFMKDNPGVKIKIETFSWGDFYTKWTTGLASGNVPDMSTALPGHVVEMMDADALEPVDDLIDDIGRNKFSKTALSEGKKDGTCYSLPLYSHAQVMWYRKDLLQKAGLSVPKTWDEFAEAAKTLTKDGVYGCSFPCGSNDLMATRFLNFYVRSGGGSLLTDDLKANLTSDLAIDGINYWLDIYKNCSPKDSVNYAVLDQANLFYQGKTAFDFNSGFQISGVETNSPDLVDQIDCAPLPKINAGGCRRNGEDQRCGVHFLYLFGCCNLRRVCDPQVFPCVNDRERAVSQRQFAFLDRLAAVDAERDLSGFAAEILKVSNCKRAGLHIDGHDLHRTALRTVFNDGVGSRHDIAVQNRDRQAGGDADRDG